MHRKIASVAIPMAPLQMKCARREYSLGDEVEFDIKVVNETDEAQDILLTPSEGLTLAQSEFENVSSKRAAATTGTHTITEYDIVNRYYEATVVAEIGEDEYEISCIANTEAPNGHLTVEMTTTSTPANGDFYVLGEVIEYDVEVVNDGNLTITNIDVICELAGNLWTVDGLAPGESQEFTTEYTCTKADILAGFVRVACTATGDSPDPDEPDVPVEVGESEDPTNEPNGHITLTLATTSTPSNGDAYVLGESIEQELTVTNDGNLTLTYIRIWSERTGDEWTIQSLAPNYSEDLTPGNIVIRETDILEGEVICDARATATSPDYDNPSVTAYTENPEPVEDPYSHVAVELTVTNSPANGTSWTAGELIEYALAVTNDGNLTLTRGNFGNGLDNYNIYASSTSASGDSSWSIQSIPPSSTESLSPASYQVTAADVSSGTASIPVYTRFASPDPDINYVYEEVHWTDIDIDVS